ncbi:MAG: hypothetical protein HPY54_16555 [Chthonomonadetes bacterium]|nr:hypothetical protein [Chthonomonadetes bacterium]
MFRFRSWLLVALLLVPVVSGYSAPIYTEDFEGATQTVDWDLNTGESWLDLNIPFQATLPADWIYGNDGWGLTSGWDIISLQPYAYQGRSFHSWAIYDSHKAASPTIFLNPGRYRLSFWLRMGSLNPRDGDPGGATWVEWGVLRKENGLSDSQPGAPGWSKSPIPQGKRLDWTHFEVTFDIAEAGEYRVGFKVGSITPLGVFANVDNLLLERAGAVLSGVVTLGDYGGDYTTQSVTIRVLNPADHSDVKAEVTTLLAANGAYEITDLNVAAGTYDIALKGSHWLTAVVPNVTLPGGTASATLINGDVDGDNEVTLFDFGQLVAAFGSMPGDSNWNPNADLDGDEEVTLFDFGVLVRNFGAIGDE